MATADLIESIEGLREHLKSHSPFGDVHVRDARLDEYGSGSGEAGDSDRLLVCLADPTTDEGWSVDDVFHLRQAVWRYFAGQGIEQPSLTIALLPETPDEERDVDESLEWDLGRLVEDDPEG